MPNYIIDPQVFYWINILGIIQTVFGIFGGLFTTVSACSACAWVYNKGRAENYDDNKMYAKIFKKITIVFGVLGLIMIVASIFIPGKTTSIEMLISKTATFSNVEWSVQQIKEVVDYIVQAIKTV